MGVVALVLVGGAFYGGIKYGQTPKALAKLSRTQIMQAFAGGGRMGGMFGGRGGGGNGGGFVAGSIVSMDDKSITIQLPNNGGSKIVFFSDSMTVSKSVEGSKSDLATGQQLVVTGATNSDGSVTAKNIQIRPAQQSSQ